jgi:hypothetical protein
MRLWRTSIGNDGRHVGLDEVRSLLDGRRDKHAGRSSGGVNKSHHHCAGGRGNCRYTGGKGGEGVAQAHGDGGEETHCGHVMTRPVAVSYSKSVREQREKQLTVWKTRFGGEGRR